MVDSNSVLDCCNFQTLPTHDFLFDLLDKVTSVLEQEKGEYRPLDKDNNPGGLVELLKPVSSVIIPDIHARPKFVHNFLSFTLPKRHLPGNKTVLQALEEKKINLVCVGDAFHTERTVFRWELIQKEFAEGNFTGPQMCQEMTECLASFCALLQLKLLFKENFHFIKGNHENVLNVSHGGDLAFCKYADEGNMVKRFLSAYYGDDVLYLISMYEGLLPMIVRVPGAVISHAEPAVSLDRNQLINIKENPFYINSLIWTKNGDVKENTAQKIIENLEKEIQCPSKSVYYFTGHRPVKHKYETRQEGKVVQIHNPLAQNVAIVNGKKKFNFSKDIISVNQKYKQEE